VFRPHVVVVQPFGLFLRDEDDALRSLSEAVGHGISRS